MKKMYTSIDIGSDTVKMIVAQIKDNEISIIATSEVESKGIRKGVIIDANEALSSIKEVINQIEGKIGIKVKSVLASIPAYYAEIKKVTGMSTVTNEDKKVNGDDILRCLQASVYNKFTEDKSLVNVLPIKFKLDNKDDIIDPKGLVGNKLQAEAVMITTPKKNVDSVISILQSIGISVSDVNISPIADYYQYNKKEYSKAVVGIINIGADTTTLSIFNNGIISNMKILRYGGSNIDEYISQIFKIEKQEAKKIKEKFVVAHKRYAQIDEVYETINLNKNLIKITQYDASRVTMNITEEILENAKNELNLLTKDEIKYIIITGGSSELYRMSYLLEEKFNKLAIVANTETIGIRNNKFSVASGLIKCFDEKLKLRNKDFQMFLKEDIEEMTDQKKRINISNNSPLKKAFGYLFDN